MIRSVITLRLKKLGRWIGRHPARFLYLFVVSLVVSIFYSVVQAILSAGPGALLDLRKLNRTFVGQLTIGHPLLSCIVIVVCLVTAGIGWHFDHRYKMSQTRERIKAVISDEVDSIRPASYYHAPINHYHFYGRQQMSPPVMLEDVQRSIRSSSLPPLSNRLIGREALLRDLKQRLYTEKSPSLYALSGLPGVGKTTIAIALGHDEEVTGYFADGVLWARLGPQPDVLASLGQWGIELGISSAEMEKLTSIVSRAQAIHDAIGSRRMLLLIDDAWSTDVAQALLVGGMNCVHLVTTRKREVALHMAGEETIELHELSGEDGLKLLEQMIPEVIASEPDQVRELIQAVGGLPLALVLVGKYLQVQGGSRQPRRLHAALEQLRSAPERLRLSHDRAPLDYHFGLPEGATPSLSTIIGMSDKALDKASRRALRALSIFPPKPNTFSEAAALTVTGANAKTLDTLVDVGLLETGGSGRYMLHQTIHDYATASSLNGIIFRRSVELFRKVAPAHMSACKRMVRFFIGYVEEHAENYAALEREMSNILVALCMAPELGMQAALARRASAFFPFLQPRGMYQLAETYLKQAEKDNRASGDMEGLVRTLLDLGELAERQGNYVRAENYLQEGLELARQLDSVKGISVALRNLGEVARDRGAYTQAKAYLQEGLELARRLGDAEIVSALLATLGAVAGHCADYRQAEVCLQEGLELARQIHHPRRMSSIFSTLGDVAAHQGDYAQAEAYLQEGLKLARENAYDAIVCALLKNLGSVARDQGDYPQAEAYLQEGLRLASKIKHRGRMSALLSTVGNVELHRGRYEQAEKYLREGLELARRIDHKESLCLLLQNMGTLETHRDNYEQAEKYLQEGLDLARQTGLRRITCAILRNLGNLASELGDYTRAKGYLQEGLNLAREIGHPGMIISLLLIHGEILEQLGDDELAEKCLFEGLNLSRQVNHSQRTCSLLANLGIMAIRNGQYAKAEDYLREGLGIARIIQHPGRICKALQRLGVLECSRGNYEQAEVYLQESLAIARKIGRNRLVGETLCVLGEIRLRQNRFGAASAVFRQVLALRKEVGDQKLIALAQSGIERAEVAQ